MGEEDDGPPPPTYTPETFTPPPPPPPPAPMYTPAGWYPDPGGEGKRYWTGSAWAAAVPPLPPRRSWSRRQKVAVVVAPLLVMSGCVAMLIPRADPRQLTESGSYEVCYFGCEATPGKWKATAQPGPNPCRWARMKDGREVDSGEVARGRTVEVELLENELFFTAESCLPWVAVR